MLAPRKMGRGGLELYAQGLRSLPGTRLGSPSSGSWQVAVFIVHLCETVLSAAFSQRPLGAHPPLNKLCDYSLQQGRPHTMGATGSLRKRGRKEPSPGFGFVWGRGACLKKQESALAGCPQKEGTIMGLGISILLWGGQTRAWIRR